MLAPARMTTTQPLLNSKETNTVTISVLHPSVTPAATPCRSNDPELWFAESPTEVERAKSLCGGCPFRVRCLDDAIARSEPWGVWGGELLSQGVVIPRKRPRGRPRKDQTCPSAPARQLSA